MSDLIKFKKGLAANAPILNLAEPALFTDDGDERLAIGGTKGNVILPNKKDIDSITSQLDHKQTQISNLNIIKADKTDLNATNNNIANLQIIKADTSYVDTKIATVASGAPKGTYATLSALQTAHPTGDTGNYVVATDGHIYNWNNSAWIDTGIQYQSTGIANKSVSAEKLNFLKVGKENKYDSSTDETGALDTTTGVDASNEQYRRTKYIPINNGDSADGVQVTIKSNNLPSTPYYFLYQEIGGNGFRVTDYTKTNNTITFTVSGDYKYLRTLTLSPTGGNYGDGLEIIANGFPNATLLKNKNLVDVFVQKDQVKITSDITTNYEIYDNLSIVGGLNSDGTDANATEYSRTSYLKLNNDTVVAKSVKIYGIPSVYAPSYFFLYKKEGEIGFIPAASYNSEESCWEFNTEDYNFLRFNVVSPNWTINGVISVIVTPNPNQLIIKDINLDNRFLSKKYAELINKLPRPDSGIVHFTVPLNMYNADVKSDTLTIQDGSNVLNDNAILFIPTNYSEIGEPIRLIINCHGAGTNILPSTTALSNPVPNLIQLGYAVLDVNGKPENYSGSLGLHFGAPFALQSYIKAYQYAIKNYNLKQEVFVIGISMGGLTSNMIVQSGVVPVLAQASFCGVVDHFKQAYCNPWSSGQREMIANYFGFKGTAPTWTLTGTPTQAEKDYYKANIDKVIGYNPIIKNTFNWNNSYLDNIGDSSETENYNSLIKYHPVPLKVWHNDDDTTVLPRYSEYYVNAIRNAGGLAYLRKFPSGGHNAWDNGDTITMTDIEGNSLSVTVSTYELYQWLKRFE